MKDKQLEDVQMMAQHEKAKAELLTWDVDRLVAAREEVGRCMPSFANRAGDVETWSGFYCNCLIAADQRIKESKP